MRQSQTLAGAIGGLYGSIVEFSVRAQSNMPIEQIQVTNNIKLACHDMVSAVKGVQEVHVNLVTHLRSSNPVLRGEYEGLRLRLAKVLGLLARMERNGAATMEDMIDARQMLLRADYLENGLLDALVRHQKITNPMAATLMNDNVTVQTLCHRLLNIAEHYARLDLRSIINRTTYEANQADRESLSPFDTGFIPAQSYPSSAATSDHRFSLNT
ncbi:MAG: hypothetical protein HQL53_12025 [Magnetococcales bacterium]|nr:hypothetical protein [Magnetococcales bacterium]